MRVLVLGGTRFIGPWAVRHLLDRDCEVAVFHRGRHAGDLPAGVRRLHGERRELDRHREAFAAFAPDVVLDMLAFTASDARQLVDTFRGLADRVVLVSSADVYRAYGRLIGVEPGPPDPTPLDEDAPLREKRFPYRAQASGPDDFRHDYDKIPAEEAVLAAGEPAATVVRLPMVYGPGDGQHRLAPYLRRMDAGRPAIVLDEGLARWRSPRAYVEDAGLALALTVLDARARGRVYNVADAEAFGEAEWVRAIGRAAGWSGAVVPLPSGRIPVPLDVGQDLVLDSTRIRRELGFAETIDREEGLRRTVAWERDHLPEASAEVGMADWETEDALLAEHRGGGGRA